MKKNLITSTLLAMAGIALLTQPAKATTLSYSDGDILLGFHDSSKTTDYVLDLGNFSQFQGHTVGYSTTLSLGSVGTDLTNIFGAGWTNSSSVYWGAVGTDSNTDALFATRAEIYGVQSHATAWARQNDTNQSGVNTTITGMGYNAFDSNASTANSSVGFAQPTSMSDSWANWQPGGGNSSGISLAYFNPTIEGNFQHGTGNGGAYGSGSVLNLFEMQDGSGSGSYLGSFTINDSGSVTFQVTSVPEPSTYAMVAAGGLLVLSMRNRLRKKQA
jgi:hypothetical protein